MVQVAGMLRATLATAAAAVVFFAGSSVLGGEPSSPDTASIEFFETRVRPVLSDHCFGCHSARAKKLKGGLRLDGRDLVLKGGESGAAVVSGDPEHSRLIEAIRYQNSDLRMPPKSRLQPQQVADLVEWVKRGAPWPDGPPPVAATGISATPSAPGAFDLWKRRASHWAWQPVRPQSPPAVADATWARDPVDAFILAKLQAAGLRPAPPAERRVLLRRLSFVLTGLPPTADEVDAYVGDSSPGATERVVDRLLASPQFGERWARHWMDLVRYSDTLGNEADMPVHNAWRYRDYLIRAFNDDLPYDRLVLEHVAGDLLPDPRLNPREKFDESVIGTGFFWMTEGKRSPVDLRLAQAEAFDNRLDVTCKTFLGLTVACARCHDHKFDAIASSDYYGLYGYLKSSRYTQALLNKAEFDRKAVELAALREKLRQGAAALLIERAKGLGAQLNRAGGVTDADTTAGSNACTADDVAARWAKAIEAATDPMHPLYLWRKMAELGPSAPASAVAARWKELAAELQSRAAADQLARCRKNDIELAHFD